MQKAIAYGETPVIFLAMFWGGGGPFTIPQIIHVYDWINRAIPNRLEMETALNTLLAMGLIERRDDSYKIPQPQFLAFEAFKNKKRKNKFDLVTLFFNELPDIPEPPRVVVLTEDEYQAHYKAYKKAFSEALQRSR